MPSEARASAEGDPSMERPPSERGPPPPSERGPRLPKPEKGEMGEVPGVSTSSVAREAAARGGTGSSDEESARPPEDGAAAGAAAGASAGADAAATGVRVLGMEYSMFDGLQMCPRLIWPQIWQRLSLRMAPSFSAIALDA